jgi:hypothetical protein
MWLLSSTVEWKDFKVAAQQDQGISFGKFARYHEKRVSAIRSDPRQIDRPHSQGSDQEKTIETGPFGMCIPSLRPELILLLYTSNEIDIGS